jgi:ThiF family
MVEKLIKLLNERFNSECNFTLEHPFLLNEDDALFGKISIETSKGILLFDVSIPSAYPLGTISFICTNVTNSNHQNSDNSICIHPTPNINIDQKLNEEITLLKDWIKKYYINEELDNRYQYLFFDYNKVHFLFDNTIKELHKGDCGIFSFCQIAQNTNLILAFDKISLNWSQAWLNSKNRYVGSWLYIEDEPIVQKREIVKNWLDLEQYLTDKQFKHLYSRKGYTFPILVGYKIPTIAGFEIHWEVTFITKDNFPTESVKIGKNWTGQCKDFPIQWGKTYNASYERYFGRGKFHDTLTDSTILLIGLGALGSNIAVSLTRGGIRRLNIMDYDNVEPGNICRSEYSMIDLVNPKMSALFGQLLQISPFIEVGNEKFAKIPYVSSETETFKIIQEALQKYDFIIDCSTDDELSYFLDTVKLESTQILNFSISNKAKNLVFVTGKRVNKDIKHIFNSLENQDASFFEGAGCQYPTFEASYNDINLLISCALKNINSRLKDNLPLRNFVVSLNDEIGNFKVEVNEY